MSLLVNTRRDPGIALFNAAIEAGAPIHIEAGMRVLEIGCCEADWLHLAHAAWPEVELVGIDTRAPNVVDDVQRRQGDAMDPDLFQPESFDAIVSLSAIEHIGLGHYGDPKDPDGDSKAMANVWRWLKPNGWFYFDVPYDPLGYQVLGTECRIYDDAAMQERLWIRPLAEVKAKAQWLWDGYAGSDEPGALVEKPRRPHSRYWYAAHVWRKA
jgi:SAM-dependent methyltransferase